MTEKIEPINPILTEIYIAPESRNRDLKSKDEFKRKLKKAIEERKNKMENERLNNGAIV